MKKKDAFHPKDGRTMASGHGQAGRDPGNVLDPLAAGPDDPALARLAQQASSSSLPPALRQRIHDDASRNGWWRRHRPLLLRGSWAAAALFILYALSYGTLRIEERKTNRENLERLDDILSLVSLCAPVDESDWETMPYETIDESPTLGTVARRFDLLAGGDVVFPEPPR